MSAAGAIEAALTVLRERLRAVSFSGESLRRLLGVAVADDVGPLNHAPALARLQGTADPSAVLARLLYLEAGEPRRNVAAVFGRHLLALLQARLLVERSDAITARARLDCVEHLWLLADRRFRAPDRHALYLPAGDMVYPPGGDSALLATVVRLMRGGRVLDLCTGSGVQGLIAAAQADTVVAVDCSARAVACARLNARLNGIDNFAVREGDLFAPVRGERFDLIIANPPFVPGPRRGPSYHWGGPRGDRTLRRVVAGLGRHLRDGGRAVIISHLALIDGQDVAAAVRPWWRHFPGRALVLELEEGSPVDLAAAQSLFALDDGLAAYGREVDRWVAYLHRHRVRSIVLIVLVAEAGAKRACEVVRAHQRMLPLPLAKPATDLVQEWMARDEKRETGDGRRTGGRRRKAGAGGAESGSEEGC